MQSGGRGRCAAPGSAAACAQRRAPAERGAVPGAGQPAAAAGGSTGGPRWHSVSTALSQQQPNCAGPLVTPAALRPSRLLCCLVVTRSQSGRALDTARDTRGRSTVEKGGWGSNNNSIAMRWQGARLGRRPVETCWGGLRWSRARRRGAAWTAQSGQGIAVENGACMGYWVQQGFSARTGQAGVEKGASMPRAASAAAPLISGRQQATRAGTLPGTLEGGGEGEAKRQRVVLVGGGEGTGGRREGWHGAGHLLRGGGCERRAVSWGPHMRDPMKLEGD